jgi:acyl dehydratase
MGRVIRNYEEGDEITPLVKELTQDAINLFEGSAGNTGPSQFTDEHAAKEVLGTEGTVASGRMSLTFSVEMLRRHFSPEVFNHTGTVDLRFLRPVRPGDTVTFTGKVIGVSKEANGNRVSVDIEVKNQRGDTTGVGQGSAIVPNAFLPPEDL